MGISRIDLPVALRIHLIDGRRVLRRRLVAGRSIPDRREMRTAAAGAVRLSRRSGRGVGGRAIALASAAGGALALLVDLTLVVLFLFARLPFLADLLEF